MAPASPARRGSEQGWAMYASSEASGTSASRQSAPESLSDRNVAGPAGQRHVPPSERLEHGFFGVLYAMARRSSPSLATSRVVSFTALLLDFFQLLSFSTSRGFSFGSTLRPLGDFLLVFRGSSTTQTPPAELLYFALVCVGLAVLDAVYVARNIHHKTLRFVSAIRVLQLFVRAMVTVLYIPFVLVFLMHLRCSGSDCWSGPQVLVSLLSIASLVVVVVFSFAFTAVYYESDRDSGHLLARMHSRAELVAQASKTAIVTAFVFIFPSERTFVALVTLAASIAVFAAFLVLLPYYRRRINIMRCALYAGWLWATLCQCLAVALDRPQDSVAASLLLAGILPAMWLGAFLARRRLAALAGLVEHLDDQKTLPWWQQLHFPTDAEIAARAYEYGHAPADDAGPEAGAATAEAVSAILLTGLEIFPKSSLLTLAYSKHLYSIGDSSEAGVYLTQARRFDPPVDMRFYLFRLDRDRERVQQSETVGESMNLVEYVEFQNNFHLARLYHQKALRAARRFWRLLLETRSDPKLLDRLPAAAVRISSAAEAASEHYGMLLRKYPHSPRIHRSYAQFLANVLNDDARAVRYLQIADDEEEAEQQRRRDAQNQNMLDTLIDANDRKSCVVTIDSHGIIQSCTHGLAKLLGYTRTELIRKNVSVIMPQPYRSRHDGYIANNLRTGRRGVVGKVRYFDAATKTGELVPISLRINQAVLQGKIFFVGQIEPQHESSPFVTVSPQTGHIVSCNKAFTSAFGYPVSELEGTAFDSVVRGDDPSATTAAGADFASRYAIHSNPVARHAIVRTRQGAHVPVSLRFAPRGQDVVHVSIDRLADCECVVSINPDGTIISANAASEYLLGWRPDDLIGSNVTVFIPQPMAAYHAHFVSRYLDSGVRTVLGRTRRTWGKHRTGKLFGILLQSDEEIIDGERRFSARVTLQGESSHCEVCFTRSGTILRHETSHEAFFGHGIVIKRRPIHHLLHIPALGQDVDWVADPSVLASNRWTGYVFDPTIDTLRPVSVVARKISDVDSGPTEVATTAVTLRDAGAVDVLLGLDTDLAIKTTTETISDMFGYQPDTVGGLPFSTLFTASADVAFPSDLPPMADLLLRRTVLPAKHRDGSEFSISVEACEDPDSDSDCHYRVRLHRLPPSDEASVTLRSKMAAQYHEAEALRAPADDGDTGVVSPTGSLPGQADSRNPSVGEHESNKSIGNHLDSARPSATKPAWFGMEKHLRNVHFSESFAGSTGDAMPVIADPDEAEHEPRSSAGGSSRASRSITRLRSAYVAAGARMRRSIRRYNTRANLVLLFVVLCLVGMYSATLVQARRALDLVFAAELCAHSAVVGLEIALAFPPLSAPGAALVASLRADSATANLLEQPFSPVLPDIQAEFLAPISLLDASTRDDWMTIDFLAAISDRNHRSPSSLSWSYLIDTRAGLPTFDLGPSSILSERLETLIVDNDIRLVRQTDTALVTESSDLLSAVVELGSAAGDGSSEAVFFVAANAQSVILPAVLDITEPLLAHAEAHLALLQDVYLGILIGLCVVCLFAIFFVFERAVQPVRQHRMTVLELFVKIDKAEVKSLANRRTTIDEDSDESDDEQPAPGSVPPSAPHTPRLFRPNHVVTGAKRPIELGSSVESTLSPAHHNLSWHARATRFLSQYRHLRSFTVRYLGIVVLAAAVLVTITLLGADQISRIHSARQTTQLFLELAPSTRELVSGVRQIRVQQAANATSIDTSYLETLYASNSALLDRTISADGAATVLSDPDLWLTGGLVQDLTDLRAAVAAVLASPNDTDEATLAEINAQSLRVWGGLLESTRSTTADKERKVRNLEIMAHWIFGICLAFNLATSIWLLAPLFRHLERENSQSLSMLLMVPEDVSRKTKAIIQHLSQVADDRSLVPNY